MAFMSLQAVDEGLGTCCIGSFYEDQVKTILGIPGDVRVVELITLGYPAAAPAKRDRLPIEKVACRDQWSFSFAP